MRTLSAWIPVVSVLALGCGGEGVGGGDSTRSGSGGAGGSGGTDGGSGGAGAAGGGFTKPPPKVLDCSKLPAEGNWESIPLPLPEDFVLPENQEGVNVSAFHADPHVHGSVYVSRAMFPWIAGLGFWRSDDCGATWARVAKGRNAEAMNSGAQNYMLFDPRDPDVIISQSFYGDWRMYKSTNRGVDWDDITPDAEGAPPVIQGISMDPSDPDHLIVTFHADCGGGHKPMCLGETLDQGKTWKLVDGPFPADQGWSEAAGPLMIDSDTWLLTVPGTGVFQTKNRGADWDEFLGYPGCSANLFREPGGDYFLACGDGLGIQRSQDADTWTFVENSPTSSSVILAGSSWFAASSKDESGQPVRRAPAEDITNWSVVATPQIVRGGNFSYDEVHKVLYMTAHTEAWRVVSK